MTWLTLLNFLLICRSEGLGFFFIIILIACFLFDFRDRWQSFSCRGDAPEHTWRDHFSSTNQTWSNSRQRTVEGSRIRSFEKGDCRKGQTNGLANLHLKLIFFMLNIVSLYTKFSYNGRGKVMIILSLLADLSFWCAYCVYAGHHVQIFFSRLEDLQA